jgi:hypothetical protein
MLSWKTTRIVCTILLLLPLVHLAYLRSRDALAILDPSPDVWAKELSAYARADRAAKLPQDPLVIVGGRRVKLWDGLDEILAEPVLVRGLGDAIVEDITYNYNALIGYYQPAAVVLLPGNSEFHIRDSKSASELLEAVQALEEVDNSLGVSRHFFVFTPVKTPLYPRDYLEIEEATRLLADWAQQRERVTVLDANALLCDETGRPRPRYYLSDGVNLNELGYLRLALLLQSALEAGAAPLAAAR